MRDIWTARIAAVCMLWNAQFADASTLQVNVSLGTDTPTCGIAAGAGACQSIGYAVGIRAAANDSIVVAAGTYHEHVTVGIPGLTLLGAQAGVDARTRNVASETVLDGATTALDTGISVNADSVTIDGFTIQNYNGGGAAFGYGIVQAGTVSGVHVVNNILRANGYTGLYMGCAGATPCVARYNLFDANQAAGGGGDGIYNDFGTVNVLIDSNRFTNHINGSVIITGVASTTQNNITISNNDSVDDGLIALFGVTNATIIGNTAMNPVAGIRVDGSQHVVVTGNTVIGGPRTTFYAFRASDNNGFPNPVDQVTVIGNTFLASNFGVLVTNNFASPLDPAQGPVLAGASSLTLRCNRIVGNTAGGLLNGDTAHTVLATQNWWGCNAGPNQASCDTANGGSTNPWLVLRLTATPNPITLGSATQLTASLNTDSNGATATCSLPDITPAAFVAAAGLTNVAGHTTAGTATATYTPTGAGVTTVSVDIDGQAINLLITALAAVAPIVPAPVPLLSQLGLLLLGMLVTMASVARSKKSA